MLPNKQRKGLLMNSPHVRNYFFAASLCVTLISCHRNINSKETIPVESQTDQKATDDFEDYAHYPEYEKWLENSGTSSDDHGDETPTMDRLLASATRIKPPTKVHVVSAGRWGQIEIKITNIGHPSYSPYQIKIEVLCKNRNFKPQVVLKELKACDFNKKDAVYKKDVETFTIRYLMQSPDARPSEPTCNEIWEQDFDLPEICADDKH